MKPGLIICIAFSLTAVSARSQTGPNILQQMHTRYAGKWYHTFTFNQTTEMYRNDSLRRKETWYEAVSFPDKFRIDFGNIDSGNAVIFTGDSSYDFRRGKLRQAAKDDNDLTFLLGGMYFYPYAKVIEKITALGYNLDKTFATTWKGNAVYVIGVSSADEKANQLWVDKEKLVLVRQVKYDARRKEDVWFENQIPLAGGFTETKVTAYINDKLIQVEYYHDCKANPVLDDALFDPLRFGKK